MRPCPTSCRTKRAFSIPGCCEVYRVLGVLCGVLFAKLEAPGTRGSASRGLKVAPDLPLEVPGTLHLGTLYHLFKIVESSFLGSHTIFQTFREVSKLPECYALERSPCPATSLAWHRPASTGLVWCTLAARCCVIGTLSFRFSPRSRSLLAGWGCCLPHC